MPDMMKLRDDRALINLESACKHAVIGEPWPCYDCLRLIRLEAKLDRLMQALEAGAIGRWTGLGPRP